MTSSNGNIFRVTGPLCGEFTGPGEFPAQRPVTRSFDVFFDLSLNKRLSKQSWGWWFETSSGSLWHHCNDTSNGDVLCVSSVLAKNCWKNSKFVVNLSLMWCQCIGIYGASPDAHTRFRALLCFAAVMYRFGTVLVHILEYYFTHWGRDKMSAILQTTFSNAFSWMKRLNFD